MYRPRLIGLAFVLGLFAGAPGLAQGPMLPDSRAEESDRTPPRLSFVDAQVSFWRPGADGWVQAQTNTPLAPGDQLFTGSPGNLELQIGARAFVRGWANTQIGFENQEPDFLQFKVTAGRASFDLRSLEPGHTVEVATPNAAFTIEHPGYYRVNVLGERTSFIARRAGRAVVTTAIGESVAVAASEEVVIEGTDGPRVTSFVAPALDEWDKWNYARTDALLDAVSARYVPYGTYGVDDLDHHGNWRIVDQYGPVWVPSGVPSGWAPYTTGAWTLDPYFGWSWVDTAPWGWAPFHYGRWVFVNNLWAWAPGPVLARPVYAPALVAFLGGPGVQVSVGVGVPRIGWVALGWGEPCVPWWGRSGFIHRPWWGGWGGPRVVNNVVIQRTTVVHVEQINVYRNAHVHNAVVVVNENHFGRGPIAPMRVHQADARDLRPNHTGPKVSPAPASFVPTTRPGQRPSQERSVVATRPPHDRGTGHAGSPAPRPRLVTAPAPREPAAVLSRPPFGQSGIERPAPDRPQPPGREERERPKAIDGRPQGTRTRAAQPPVVRPAPEAKSVAPVPVAPSSPVKPPEMSRPSVERSQSPAAPRVEGQERSQQGPGTQSSADRPGVPQPQPKIAAPPPVKPPEMSRPSVERSQPSASRGESQGGNRQGPNTQTPAARPAAPQPRPKIAAPPSGGSQPYTGRREETPVRQLPGEPANRLSPGQSESRQEGRGGQRGPEPRQQGERGQGSRNRSAP